MDNDDILREEIARAIEANRAKSVLQIHFDERRAELQEALLVAPAERLMEIRAALVELDRLEQHLDGLEASGRMARKQLEENQSLN